MCGVVGAIARDGDLGCFPACRRAAAVASLRHRGPDAQGEFCDASVWLGHTRLSILDLSDAGAQPMATPDGRLVIAYNGEVYNFRELAAELALDGLRSRSDTEVVLRAFEALGGAAFAKLNGMFALALYDVRAGKVWLARDPLGIKPLFYRVDRRGLCFASEIKALRALAPEPAVCDLSSLHEWLYYGNALGGRTLYRGIRQLLPGHLLELDLTTFDHEVREYWSVPRQLAAAAPPSGSAADLAAETLRLLDHAVRRQLVSDVPVGVFLSGGVDSSAITALASRHYGGRLATYSAGFDGDAADDERPKARRLAAQFGTDHHELFITGGDVPDLVERMVRQHDMPFGDAANIPLFVMASQISARTKVVLQGDGGDELFGGYRRHVTLSYYRSMHALARLGVRARRLLPPALSGPRVQRYIRAFAADDLGTTMALLLSLETVASQPAAVFSEPIRRVIAASDPFARYRACQAAVSHCDAAHQMSLVDLMIELPDIFLEKVDRATMAASLEVRVPFLDQDLVNFVVAIPGAAKNPWGRKKWLLKKALEGIVPDDILRAPKAGFNVPFGAWLRGALKPLFFDHLSTFTRTRPGVLDAAKLTAMYDTTAAGTRDESPLVWKMLNFLIWCNTTGVEIAA